MSEAKRRPKTGRKSGPGIFGFLKKPKPPEGAAPPLRCSPPARGQPGGRTVLSVDSNG